MPPLLAERLVLAAETLARNAVAKLGTLLPCAAMADDACAARFVGDFGLRTWRRPLTPDELTRLQGLDWKNNRSTPLVAAAQVDMAVAALAWDFTRVITLQVGHEGSGMSHPWVGVAGGHHYDLGHSSDKDLARVSDIIKVGQWHAGLFASLITKLGAIPEAGGTLLDSTLLVWVNGMTKGNQHSNSNHPTVLAGRFGGSIKTGPYLRVQRTGPKYQYPLPTGKSYGDLWWEVLRAAGIGQPSFGDPRYFHGGIPELRA